MSEKPVERDIRNVALIYDGSNAYDLKVMTGIADYVHHSLRWNVYLEPIALMEQGLPDLRSWSGDGIIANFDHPKVAREVVRSKLPAVAFGGGYGWYSPSSSIPYFFSNQTLIAEVAADHLLQRGFRNFAFCGYPRNHINGWSEDRQRVFCGRVGKRGFDCTVYTGIHQTRKRWTPFQKALGAWLVSLPKPVGLMCADDNLGRQVLEACRTSNIRVPTEVAVIAVDNDELLCRMSTPLLTSVEQGTRRIGYEAAALLDKLMEGGKRFELKSVRFVIDPIEVIGRRSTETLATDDPKVAESLVFIATQLSSGLKARNVIKNVAVSRSSLESRFKRALGITIHTAIRQAQLSRTKQLVYDTDLPLKQIAADLGYTSVQQMTTLFRSAFGQSPARYRRMSASR